MGDGYKHKGALFGKPPYGGSISQTLHYSDSDLCSWDLDKTAFIPRKETDDFTPFILMGDRGGCTFVQKARNAQHAGAAALVIADNLCLCSDTNCTEGILCEAIEPVMSDDGSAGDVTIPSMLLYKPDADKLKEELKKENAYMKIEMTWNIPNPDNRVEYDLWTLPSEIISKEFHEEWKDIALNFGKSVRFTPHQYIFDGTAVNCNDSPERCETLCTNNNRYCANDPDGDRTAGISGADVVKESLRRICVWRNFGEVDGIGEKYWDYIREFNYRCFAIYDEDYRLEFFFSPECINDVYEKANIDGNMIEKCMADSGGTDDDPNGIGNNFLDKELADQKELAIVVLPTMDVNNIALRGGFSSSTIFDAVCAGFSEGSQPVICNPCVGCQEIADCVANGVCTQTSGGTSPQNIDNGSTTGSGSGVVIDNQGIINNDNDAVDMTARKSENSSGISSTTFGITLLFICAVFGGVGYLHWKKTRSDMKEQVRGILAEYMPLEGNDGNVQNGSPMDFTSQAGSNSLIS